MVRRDDNSFHAHKTAPEIPHGSVEKGGQGPQRARRREWMSVNERTWRWAAALHLQQCFHLWANLCLSSLLCYWTQTCSHRYMQLIQLSTHDTTRETLSDARRPSRVLSSRCDSTLLLMLRGDLRSAVSKSFCCGDKRTAKPSKGFFLNNVSALNVLTEIVFMIPWERV